LKRLTVKGYTLGRLQFVDKIFGNENYLRELESEGNVLL